MLNTPNALKIVAKKPTLSNSHDRITYKVSFCTQIILGKIVTAYNEGQCTINAGHSWKSGDEIFWQKADNGIVIMCNNKDCFKNQGGEADGKIEAKQEKPTPPKTIEKHSGQTSTTEIQQNDADLHGAKSGQKECKKCGFKITVFDAQTQKNWDAHVEGHEHPQAKEMDAVDFAAKAMLEEYITYAKEIKIIEEALVGVFPEMVGDERGMKTKLLWNVKHPNPI